MSVRTPLSTSTARCLMFVVCPFTQQPGEVELMLYGFGKNLKRVKLYVLLHPETGAAASGKMGSSAGPVRPGFAFRLSSLLSSVLDIPLRLATHGRQPCELREPKIVQAIDISCGDTCGSDVELGHVAFAVCLWPSIVRCRAYLIRKVRAGLLIDAAARARQAFSTMLFLDLPPETLAQIMDYVGSSHFHEDWRRLAVCRH